MSLGAELRRSGIGHPDLDRPEPAGAHSFAISSRLVDRAGVPWRFLSRGSCSSVTCNLAEGLRQRKLEGDPGWPGSPAGGHLRFQAPRRPATASHAAAHLHRVGPARPCAEAARAVAEVSHGPSWPRAPRPPRRTARPPSTAFPRPTARSRHPIADIGGETARPGSNGITRTGLARSSAPSGENPEGVRLGLLGHVAMERAETEEAVLHRAQAENRCPLDVSHVLETRIDHRRAPRAARARGRSPTY